MGLAGQKKTGALIGEVPTIGPGRGALQEPAGGSQQVAPGAAGYWRCCSSYHLLEVAILVARASLVVTEPNTAAWVQALSVTNADFTWTLKSSSSVQRHRPGGGGSVS